MKVSIALETSERQFPSKADKKYLKNAIEVVSENITS